MTVFKPNEVKKIEVMPMRIWTLTELRKGIERKKLMDFYRSHCPNKKKRLIDLTRFQYQRDLKLIKSDIDSYVELGLLCENNDKKLDITDYFKRFYTRQNERIHDFIKKYPKITNCPDELSRLDELKKWLHD